MRSAPVDGFVLDHDDIAGPAGPVAVLLHGWPGDRQDWRAVVPRLSGRVRLLVPDLRGFGGSDKHERDAADYAAAAQARSVAALIEHAGSGPAVVAGYDIGSRVAQALALARPDLVRALVIAPPVPGAGRRVLDPDPQREFWYQHLHRLPLATRLVHDVASARAYLEHFWTHWSGPDYEVEPAQLDRLAAIYGAPGGFAASIAWYRAGAGSVGRALAETAPPAAERIAAPTTLLWPEHDPLFPPAWADRVEDFFAAVDVQMVAGVGHFAPLEFPQVISEAIVAAVR